MIYIALQQLNETSNVHFDTELSALEVVLIKGKQYE